MQKSLSFIAAPAAALVLSFGLSGCGSQSIPSAQASPPPSPPIAIQPAVQPVMPTVPALPPSLAQADADFLKHNWDDAIDGYHTALAASLPNATATYARHRISLAHEYAALGYKDSGQLDIACNEMKASVAADKSNLEAKRLLAEIEEEMKASAQPVEEAQTSQYANNSDAYGSGDMAGGDSNPHQIEDQAIGASYEAGRTDYISCMGGFTGKSNAEMSQAIRDCASKITDEAPNGLESQQSNYSAMADELNTLAANIDSSNGIGLPPLPPKIR